MTAGRGVVHSEEPSKEFQQTGGTLDGVQLWVNLPKTDKMIRPHYQEIPAARIPSAQTPDAKVAVRVLAGESLGARAVIETHAATKLSSLGFSSFSRGRASSRILWQNDV
jgi:quercetin 2,3-dioxygenase